mmetsp:Transcript_26664/g.58042  ORF Transcript_26664/g.58042 Transcript_26664/m.58042 type:complete len:262 (-) Transcript_26664:564-1349(-)
MLAHLGAPRPLETTLPSSPSEMYTFAPSATPASAICALIHAFQSSTSSASSLSPLVSSIEPASGAAPSAALTRPSPPAASLAPPNPFSRFSAAILSLAAVELRTTPTTTMPRVCRSARIACACFTAAFTCALVPATITGRCVPLRRDTATGLEFPRFTCSLPNCSSLSITRSLFSRSARSRRTMKSSTTSEAAFTTRLVSCWLRSSPPVWVALISAGMVVKRAMKAPTEPPPAAIRRNNRNGDLLSARSLICCASVLPPFN